MLTPDYLESAPADILESYETFTMLVLEDMAHRIASMGVVSEATLDQADLLQESGMLQREILEQIAILLNKTSQEVERLFEDAIETSLGIDNDLYAKAGFSKKDIPMQSIFDIVINAGIAKTNGNLQNLTMTTAVITQQAFINAVSHMSTLVSTGAMSGTAAVKKAIYDLSDNGIYTVTYQNGKETHHKLDVAVRRAIITGVNQTAAQIQLENLSFLGLDLVETTAHMGARPTHKDWQGRIFSYSGRDKRHPDFMSSTGFGTGDGLCGWNCRHSFYPYFEGSTPAYKDLDYYNNAKVKYNGEDIDYYDATQIQRGYERNIRKYKRRLTSLNGAMEGFSDETRTAFSKEFDAQAKKLKDWEKKLADFINQTGLSRNKPREQVYKFNRSVAQKARHRGK